jgi:hypothetical protein
MRMMMMILECLFGKALLLLSVDERFAFEEQHK